MNRGTIKLESRNISLNDSIDIIEKILIDFNTKCQSAYQELKRIIEDNPGYEQIKQINNIINQDEEFDLSSKLDKN